MDGIDAVHVVGISIGFCGSQKGKGKSAFVAVKVEHIAVFLAEYAIVDSSSVARMKICSFHRVWL